MHTRTATALAAALLLTACSPAGTDAKPKPSPTLSRRERFLAAVDQADLQSWNEKHPPENELMEYPEKWCTALNNGHSVKWMFHGDDDRLYPNGWTWGTKEADAHELLILAVKAYCPKWRSQVVEELRSSGDY
ncbi:hypothetical protein AB0O20_27640 [Streptomyces kronopolitis]|uniref:hypothetical protein n=1 Tax=Streptomyces kronopolitis TaxID=1612435 RepID=UPI003446316A